MTARADVFQSGRATAGFSLLEALVVLAILSIVMAAIGRGVGRPSVEIVRKQAVAEQQERLARARHHAVRTGEAIPMVFADCETLNATEVLVFTDGTIEAESFCFLEGGLVIEFDADRITGRIIGAAAR